MSQHALGAAYAVSFLACFVSMVGIFIHGYGQMLRLATSGDILEGDNLDQLARAFPTHLLLALLILAVGILIASMVSLGLSRRSDKEGP